ncbi:cytochrome P450 [Schizophyllum amplum]|uniref:Cytochrome P450 n=1 Tax=Schizophyllum amplum TaxID=97359 RepID=A0A550CS04_9AGAR|nr:cytochrome P450 [Auriculariopsis ampla]
MLAQHVCLPSAILAAAGLIGICCACSVVYCLWFSPLSSVPGPWYAAVSDFWLKTHVARLQQCMTVHELFAKYGPVVRVGPNRLVFKDMAGIKAVYSVYKFDKGPAYKGIRTSSDADQAMTILEHAAHSARRKAWSPHYTTNNLAKFQPDMRYAARELITSIAFLRSNEPVDCLILFRHFTIEVIMSSLYGCRLDALKNWSTGSKVPVCEAIGYFPIQATLRSSVPSWLWALACKVPHYTWQQLCNADTTIIEFARNHIREIRRHMDAGKSHDDKVPMVLRLLEHRTSTTGTPLREEDIIAEAVGHMIAGTDTTAITLSYLCWELARHPDIAMKLQVELDCVMDDPAIVPDIAVLQALPYLNAFVKEGLRLYGAGPSLLERVVRETPSGQPFSIAGYDLPAGTVVAAQSWSLSRDPAVFPSPEEFYPERWLVEDTSAMSAHLCPFGFGTRICGGQNVAQIMLRIGVAAIARNFCIEVPPETTEQSMAICDAFVIFPKAMACKLAFHPRANKLG